GRPNFRFCIDGGILSEISHNERLEYKQDYITPQNNKFSINYLESIDFKKILKAWRDFMRGKRSRNDVNQFSFNLTDNLWKLFFDLKNKNYKHDIYTEFKVVDTKTRIIHKAGVRDRIVHRLIYNGLYDFFDKRFIYSSYSCRKNKGTHKALLEYDKFFRKLTKNYSQNGFVLKFDIRKCFASINHDVLLDILDRNIQDKDILDFCKEIILSHNPGLPLGNLTSQLFVNVYLHELDFYAKQNLKIKYYIRYADDIVCMFENKKEAENMNLKLKSFCSEILKLETHKEEIKTLYSGVDFLGWKQFEKHRILREKTRKNIINKYNNSNKHSYDGLMKWGNTKKIYDKIGT
ncbi:MAG: RNA-directed polymerase, partial [Patescibacteria group bacterium]|nr:RNA-directed polymerase [Patescibacteria group bacterium]